MAMTIRLQRTGTHKAPRYRIVVKDHHAKRDGRFVEILGHYNPLQEPAQIELDLERFQQRVDQGATLSNTVRSLARQVGFKG